MTTANAILAGRRARRMTQDMLAGAACVSRSTVQRAERGLSVSDENLRSLCAALGLDVLSMPPRAEAPATDGERPPTIDECGWPIRVRLAADAPLIDARILGLLFQALAMALGTAYLAGPFLQAGLARIGMGSPALQAWVERAVPFGVGALALAIPIAVMVDERHARENPDALPKGALGRVGAVTMAAAVAVMLAALAGPMFAMPARG